MNPWHNMAVKREDRKRLSRRALSVAILFTLLLAVIGLKAFQLQVFDSTWLSAAAAKQYTGSVDRREKRGTIFDCKDRELAVSIDVASISASPQHVKDARSASSAISQALAIDGDRLSRKLSTERKFVWVKRHVSPKEVKRVRDLGIEGVSFATEGSRFYPNKYLAAQLLGFTGIDGYGLEGVEYNYDRYLRGSARRHTVLKDALGRRFGSDAVRHSDTRGDDLILTIDQTIQYIVEKSLEAGVAACSAESGMAVVMAPQTGAILALANYPYYNPNSFSEYDQKSWRNRIVTDSFEPGSTLKVFTVAAALESGLVQPDTLFYAEKGEYQIGSNTIHDPHPRAWLSLAQVIKFSSNICAVKISEKIGPEALHRTLVRFGFDEKTGINCPGETAGRLLPYPRWSKMDASAIAFGQGISVSAIQLVRAVGAIANGGMLMHPFVLKAIVDPEGVLVRRFKPRQVRRAASPEAARALSKMMEAVVGPGGTGASAAIEGYRICGKTGTAQKATGAGGYADDTYIASFVGFAPAERPEIVVLVVVDEPKSGYHGGVVAAPIFRRITLETLDYMNIPPGREPKGLRASYQPGNAG